MQSLNIHYHFLNVLFLLFIAQGKIPPNATLIFEIELYAVNKGPRSVEAFHQIDKDSDKKLSELEVIWHNVEWIVFINFGDTFIITLSLHELLLIQFITESFCMLRPTIHCHADICFTLLVCPRHSRKVTSDMPTLQSVTHTYNLVFLKIAAEFSGIKATIVDFFFFLPDKSIFERRICKRWQKTSSLSPWWNFSWYI